MGAKKNGFRSAPEGLQRLCENSCRGHVLIRARVSSFVYGASRHALEKVLQLVRSFLFGTEFLVSIFEFRVFQVLRLSGSLLCKPKLDIREKLLPYIEALKIEKGRKLSKFLSNVVGVRLSAEGPGGAKLDPRNKTLAVVLPLAPVVA